MPILLVAGPRQMREASFWVLQNDEKQVIMDYEKKYNEALERAKKQRADYQKELDKTDKNSQLAGLLRAGISAIDMAFPELQESEDERIRKELIEFLREAYSKGNAPEECSKWLVWLDQPKEQNPAEWSEEDRRTIDRACVALRAYANGELPDILPSEILEYADKLQSISTKPKVEWSEEDKSRLDHVITTLAENVKRGSAREDFEFLASLPLRFNLQPKQEWSDEDKKDMAHIIRILDDCYAYGKHDLSKTDHENLVNKLKSIRPHWKPSEEQMKALHTAAYIEEMDYYGGIKHKLLALYEDLKKLM